MVSVVYGRTTAPSRGARPTQGKVARYARGADYHRVLWDRLEALLDWLRGQCPGRTRPGRGRHGPAARTRLRPAGRAGLDRQEHDADQTAGWAASPSSGRCWSTSSWRPTRRTNRDHCGTCTRCLDACPTDAFAGPYQLDARRCISYWTIEHRGPIPDALAEQLDGWVFGCDICQDVCPWNRKAPPGRIPSSTPGRNGPIPTWSNGSTTTPRLANPARGDRPRAAKRGRPGAQRRAGARDPRRRRGGRPARRRLDDRGEDPIVRAAAAWALGRIATTPTRKPPWSDIGTMADDAVSRRRSEGVPRDGRRRSPAGPHRGRCGRRG